MINDDDNVVDVGQTSECSRTACWVVLYLWSLSFGVFSVVLWLVFQGAMYSVFSEDIGNLAREVHICIIVSIVLTSLSLVSSLIGVLFGCFFMFCRSNPRSEDVAANSEFVATQRAETDFEPPQKRFKSVIRVFVHLASILLCLSFVIWFVWVVIVVVVFWGSTSTHSLMVFMVIFAAVFFVSVCVISMAPSCCVSTTSMTSRGDDCMPQIESSVLVSDCTGATAGMVTQMIVAVILLIFVVIDYVWGVVLSHPSTPTVLLIVFYSISIILLIVSAAFVQLHTPQPRGKVYLIVAVISLSALFITLLVPSIVFVKEFAYLEPLSTTSGAMNAICFVLIAIPFCVCPCLVTMVVDAILRFCRRTASPEWERIDEGDAGEDQESSD